MKIYTRTGDEGETGLFGGPRVAKDDDRIEAYGTVDELNSVIGLARAVLAEARTSARFNSQQTGEGARNGAISPEEALSELDSWLNRLQNELFELGADLATPMDAKTSVHRIAPDAIDRLEDEIDALEATLDPLKSFILPGGSTVAAHLHIARTVCRRAERRVISLDASKEINKSCIVYLNRLSDALFVAGRWINNALDKDDQPWHPSQDNA